MHEIIYTDAFIGDMAKVYSEKVRNGIFNSIDLLPVVPILGSTDLPEYIIRKYGSSVRKMPISPFLVIYKILDDEDFLILGLVHERQAY